METLVREGRYSHYDYEIWAYPDKKYFYYKILDIGGEAHFWTGCSTIREACEDFESEGDAYLAAIGHIGLLEDGEG